jgi:hypothetical protein
MWDHALVGPTCGTMRWSILHVGSSAGGAMRWWDPDPQLHVVACGTTSLFSFFFQIVLCDNIVVLWRRFAFVIGSWREELEWFICDEIGSLFDDHPVSFVIILSVLAPSLIICDGVTKFVKVVTTYMTNKRNITTKSS